MFSPGEVVVVLNERGRKVVGTVLRAPTFDPEIWEVQLPERVFFCRLDDMSAVPKVRR